MSKILDNAEIDQRYQRLYNAWLQKDEASIEALRLELECERTKALSNIAAFLERIAGVIERKE